MLGSRPDHGLVGEPHDNCLIGRLDRQRVAAGGARSCQEQHESETDATFSSSHQTNHRPREGDMAGYKDGDQWQEGDIVYTVNTANDKELRELGLDSGAYYLNQRNVKTGQKATAVYTADGELAPVKSNRYWKEVASQRDWKYELGKAWRRGVKWGTGNGFRR